MNQWLFVTAAKGLQTYVLRSDPLMEMVGGSELIESLPRTIEGQGYLATVLSQLNMTGKRDVLTDASGAARILFDHEDDAKRLARLWPLLASQYAPGLEMSVSVVPVNGNLGHTIDQAEHEINVNRNLPAAALPEAGPLVSRNRRTGLPASRKVKPLDKEDQEAGLFEPVDAESHRKRQAAKKNSADTLLDKVVPPQFHDLVADNLERRQMRWPLDLTKLTASDNSYIAIIHADANGLGAAMMACIKHLHNSGNAAKTYKALCSAIENATVAAAQKAMRGIIEKTLEEEQKDPGKTRPIPVRPIVCAGEDFTCVIRAEHAVQFAEDYLIALESETAGKFAALPEIIPGLVCLTACAGIVYCKSHFPFSRAYALAESLCGYAKKRSERKASTIAFLRLKSSLQPSDNYEEVVKHAFQSSNEADRVFLTMNPYVVGGQPANDLPKLEDLRKLVNALRDDRLPHSGLRGLVSRAYEGKTAADQAFERLCLVMQERDILNHPALRPLLDALKQLTDGGLWKAGELDKPAATPLYDALELLHLER